MLKALKYILKFLAYSLGALLLFLSLFAVLTQTQFFKDGLRPILIAEIGKQFNGTVHIGNIDGNFLNRISIDSVSIFYGNTAVFSVKKLAVSYDPISFFQDEIQIDSVTIDNPEISIARLDDGSWNIGRLLVASSDTSTGKFEKTIVLKALTVRNGSVSLHDFTEFHSDDTTQYDFNKLDYHNFDVTDLDIYLSASIKNEDIRTTITSIRFISQSPKFILANFRGEFQADRNGVSAKNLSIQTLKSRINIQAALEDENIFDGLELGELREKTTQLQMKAEHISFYELKQFLPELYFLNGEAALDLDVEGKFSNLNIRRLNLDTYSTSFKIAGSLKNLHKPESLYISAVIGDSKLDPADANRLMPSFNLPAFNNVGSTSFYGQFIGYPNKFRSTLSLKGTMGALETQGNVNLTDSIPQYQLTFSTSELDLARLLDNPDLASSITTTGDLAGEGTTFSNLHSQLNLTIDSVQIQNFRATDSKMTVTAVENSIESISMFNVNGAAVHLNAKIDRVNTEEPEFASQIALSSFDALKFFPKAGFETSINCTATLQGSGKSVDQLSLDGSVSLSPSIMKSYHVDEQELTIHLNQNEQSNKRLTIESTIGRVELNGKYSFGLLFEELPNAISSLVDRITEHTSLKDTTSKTEPVQAIAVGQESPDTSSMDFEYDIQINDLTPISAVIANKPFNAKAALSGTVKGTKNRLSLSTKAGIEEFSLGTPTEGFLFKNAKVSLQADELSSVRALERLSCNFTVQSQYGMVEGTTIREALVSVDYKNSLGNFSCSGTIDSMLYLSVSSKVSMQPETYVFDADSFTVTLNNYTWKNDNDVQIRLNRNGVRVLHAMMRHAKESIYLAGSLNSTGEFDVTSTIRNLDVANVTRWLLRAKATEDKPIFRGMVSADIHLSGSPESPIIELQANGQNMFYRTIDIGNFAGTLDYEKQLATVVAKVFSTQKDSMQTLSITGILPINLGFNKVDKRFLDMEQNFRIVSHGFSIAFLEQIVPQMKDLTGSFVGEILMRGTPAKPSYSGNLNIENAFFTFTPNNIAYQVSGGIEPDDERLVFKNMLIKNLTDTKYEGNATANGYLTLKEFQLTDFDLTTTGSLLIMSDSTRRVVPLMYGPLLAETDIEGVRMRGTPERPFLSGNLFVKDANIVFPPTKQSSDDASKLTLTYYFVNDTSSNAPRTIPDSIISGNINDSAPLSYRTPSTETENNRPGFIDLLRYDLHVETRGPTRIRMIFTPATGEELYAELEGSVRAVNDRGTANIYGEISLTQRSYYNFIKKFDATGSLRFYGPWDNPALNIKATYEGYGTIPGQLQEEQTAGTEVQQQKIIVLIDIQGTRYEPRPELSMKVQEDNSSTPVDWSSRAKSSDVQSDAISFILTGKFRDQLTSSERSAILSGSAGASLTSTFLSGMVSDFLRKEFPFIRSAEVTYSGGDIQKSADLRISGELFNGYWRFGGRILNDIGNANVNYQISLGNVFNVSSIRNLFIELERKVQGSEFSERQSNSVTNAARVYYRFSF